MRVTSQMDKYHYRYNMYFWLLGWTVPLNENMWSDAHSSCKLSETKHASLNVFMSSESVFMSQMMINVDYNTHTFFFFTMFVCVCV